MINLIVAASNGNVIGYNGKTPWHIPEDLKRFKMITMGHPIIMGRVTYEAIGRPLPGRTNIVLSRQKLDIPGVEVTDSLDKALETAEDEEVFVIGGEQIYRAAMWYVNRIYLTQVLADYEGDAFLGVIHHRVWTLTHTEFHPDPIPHKYQVFDRLDPVRPIPELADLET